jgi:hypothetical protein
MQGLEGPSKVMGGRYAYLASEHWKVGLAALTDEDEVRQQFKLAAAMAHQDGKVLMLWKELGATLAGQLVYKEESTDESEIAPEHVVRAGPYKEMGARFRKLYSEHFALRHDLLEPSEMSSQTRTSSDEQGREQGMEISRVAESLFSSEQEGKQAMEVSRVTDPTFEERLFKNLITQTEKALEPNTTSNIVISIGPDSIAPVPNSPLPHVRMCEEPAPSPTPLDQV